jgi:hypothetical protein
LPKQALEARLYAAQRRTHDICMAMTPDAIHISHSLSAPDPAADAGLAEGLSALESYKKKDPTKGSDPHYMAWRDIRRSVATKLTEP